MCGVDVLDKGCGRINVRVYVGCRIFEAVKSYLCVSVPFLDDDYGAFVRFMMMVSSMISFFRACLCLYVRLSLGFSGICNVSSTSSLMSFTFTLCMWLRWYCCWCVACFCGWRVGRICVVCSSNPTLPSSPPTPRSCAGSTTISPTRHALDLHRRMCVPMRMVSNPEGCQDCQ